jgi:hypothetical protein
MILSLVAVFLLAATGIAQNKPEAKRQKQIKQKSIEFPSIAPIDYELDGIHVSQTQSEALSLPAFGVLSGGNGGAGMAADPDPRYPATYSGAQNLSRAFITQNAKDLLQKISLNESVSIRFENQPHSPTVITDAKIKVVKNVTDSQADSAGLQKDEYRIEASIQLANSGN